MKITWKYTEEVAAGGGITTRQQTLVLGDDLAGLPIRDYEGPRVGIEVDRIAKARGEAEKIFARGSRKYDGSFTVTRTFETYKDAVEFRHSYAEKVCRSGVLTVTVDGWNTSAVAVFEAVEPVMGSSAGTTVAYKHYWVSEDWS
ncbi:MAG: hypothetical protein WCO56_11470 [Verrucomicrobiota bacterium]